MLLVPDRRGWLALAGCLLATGCPAQRPADPELLRLVAEEACPAPASPLPVPPRPPADPYNLSPAAAMWIRDAGTARPVTHLCDLPDRIFGLAATQTVVEGKRVTGGVLYSIPRIATAPRPPAIAVVDGSPGCVKGAPSCTFDLASPTLKSIEVMPDEWVNTSGWAHGIEDMCRALPADTIAVCSTATRMAYVEVGCTGHALHLGIHDGTLKRVFDLDVESPVARLYGSAADGNGGDRWIYRFTLAGVDQGDVKKKFGAASLSFDLAAPAATLEVDGVSERCLAFGLHRR